MVKFYGVCLILLGSSICLGHTAEQIYGLKVVTLAKLLQKDFGASDSLDLITKTQSFFNSGDILINQFSKGDADLALNGLESLVKHQYFKETSVKSGFEKLAEVGTNAGQYVTKFGYEAVTTVLKMFLKYASAQVGNACLGYSAYHLVNGGYRLWNIYQLHGEISQVQERYLELEEEIQIFIKDAETYVDKVAEFQDRFSNLKKAANFEDDEQSGIRRILTDAGAELRKRYDVLEKQIDELTKDIKKTREAVHDEKDKGVGVATVVGLGAVGAANYFGYVTITAINPIAGAVIVGGAIGVNVYNYWWSSNTSHEKDDLLAKMLENLTKLRKEMDTAIKLVREANARIDLGYGYDYKKGLKSLF